MWQEAMQAFSKLQQQQYETGWVLCQVMLWSLNQNGFSFYRPMWCWAVMQKGGLSKKCSSTNFVSRLGEHTLKWLITQKQSVLTARPDESHHIIWKGLICILLHSMWVNDGTEHASENRKGAAVNCFMILDEANNCHLFFLCICIRDKHGIEFSNCQR